MTRILSIIAALLWCLGAIAASAQPATEKILPMDGHITEDGRAIELNWFDAQPPRVGSVTVKRRLYGQTGGHTWQVIAEGLGPVMRYTDDTISPGIAYEYQVLRTARDIVDVGYWLAGTEIPARANRGNAYIIVDETIAEAIAPRLERFRWDLIGDGWQVQRHDVPRGDVSDSADNLKKVLALKDWLRERYGEDPFGEHTIILVGHVPIIKSGRVAPDGHGARPHPTDLFYADMDGRWSAVRTGELLDNQVPGNFIEMQIGRIDFAPVSEQRKDTEIHLLRAYFDKNHHWRMGYHGNLREAYGNKGHLAVEHAALRNVVGPEALSIGGHHDLGEENPWLWGADFGDRKGSRYATDYANKAVFTINFGSHKQQIDGRFNGMTALLAQPWYTVAVGWGARPAWWLHHMALGGSIGDVHQRTANNGEFKEAYRTSMDYFPTGQYLFRNPIWINLLGDPTLRAFPLAPPRNVSGHASSDGFALTWTASPDPDTLGYHVFRAPPGSTEFTALTVAKPVSTLNFNDTGPINGARYMVRAYGLKKVHAGSFYTLSQGAFDTKSNAAAPQDVTLHVRSGQPLRLPERFNAVTKGHIDAYIRGPAQGTLTWEEAGWIYTPPAGFEGEVMLPFSAYSAQATSTGRLKLILKH